MFTACIPNHMKRNTPPKGVAVSLYRDILVNALMDLADANCVPKQESQRDVEEIQHRTAKEGLSFLTTTLPSIGKALDRSLSQEGINLDIPGFRKKPNSVLPRFLGWYWIRIFDDQGRELPDADPQCVKAIRQLSYLLYKLEIPYSKEAATKIAADFKSTDAALPETVSELIEMMGSDLGKFEALEHARIFVTKVLNGFNPRDIKPRHGPGAVATGEQNHEKHRFSRLYDQIEREYPFAEYFCYSLMHVADSYRSWERTLRRVESGTAKVVFVPKDSRGPRLISCEPLEYQWIQQGLGNSLREHLERNAYTKGHVNFTDQNTNRSYALMGSKGEPWVTLDMKEASDRVSLGLVRYLFDDRPDVLNCLLATRTTATKLPSGDTVRLKKFAPMGSNLCFPVESFVFYALAVGCLVTETLRNEPIRCKPESQHAVYDRVVRRCCKRVFVYGDDIISRKEDYPLLLSMFPSVGLMFNKDKCCTHGSFRESCGLDAYKGVQVQPLRLKSVWLAHRKQDASTLMSYMAFSNACYVRGFHRTSELVTQLVVGEVGELPVIRPPLFVDPNLYDSPSALVKVRYESRATQQPPSIKTRFCRNLHRWEVRCLLPKIRTIRVYSDDWSMVLRRFSSPSDTCEPGIFPLAHRVSLKWAWIPLADQG